MPRHALKPALALATLFAAASLTASAQTPTPNTGLREASSFASITGVAERSQALFNEAAKVLTHPRCMNCHPASDRPLQGNDQRPHMPPVVRGPDGHGPTGAPCASCHSNSNVTLQERASYRSVPGNPRWHLAPIEMAWEGKSLAEICRQIKDPAQNGGRDLKLLHEHMAEDDLVGWGWDPGAGRDPAPGNQKIFGDLIQAWIDTGAECPG